MKRILPPSLLLLSLAMPVPASPTPPERTESRPIAAADVARQPAPGTAVPGSIAFTPDCRAVTYLKAEGASLSRVLWKADVAGNQPPRVIARAPDGGDTDANVSREEALRRERQRLRDTGITQVVRASGADVAVIPLRGNLYLLKGDAALEPITNTPSPELDPQLTADGSKVAYVRDGELHVMDLATKVETRLTEGAADGLTHGLAEFMAQEEMDRSSGFWWSPDGSMIAYQETDERHIPNYAIVHQGGDDISVENHRYPFPGAANARVRLGVVPASGGETRWLDLAGPDADFYLARVEWDGPGHLLVQTLDREQKTLRLERIDAKAGGKTLLIEEKAPSWVNLHHDLRTIPGTGEILWTSERSGFRHLELRDRDGKLIRTLTEGPWAVDAVERVDAERREVWFSSGLDTPLERHLCRVSLDGGPHQKVTAEVGTHRAVVAADGQHFVDTWSYRMRPPITRLIDRDGQVKATLDDAMTSDPRVAELGLAPPELVEFSGRDGSRLFGAFYAPRSGAFGEKAPLIVMLYGGPHVQYVSENWTLTADLTAQFLAGRGFAVWKMDNRGSARRGHEFEAALHLNMGSVEVRDQADGVAFVGRTWPGVDTTRVGVTGGSYGGYMTLRCLEQAPETFHAGVSVAPVTSWDGYDTCYTERYMGTPASNPGGYKASSVLERVDHIRGELLIIHGMIDENVHFRHSARLASALIAAGKPFRLLPLPEERHSSRKEPGRAYVAEQVAGFFASALGGRVR
ncbi:S9 family peptidase [Tundrisphaera sp. TA3]|uniref:S9 family peptidase n=1 Tax=Tundrisphaera sp. TA3 TaxID=3435775 RepID=UPI003EBA56F1